MQSFAQKPVSPSPARPARKAPPPRVNRKEPIPFWYRAPGKQAAQRASRTGVEAGTRFTATASPRSDHRADRFGMPPVAGGGTWANVHVNEPGDAHEREAERISEQVMLVPRSEGVV